MYSLIFIFSSLLVAIRDVLTEFLFKDTIQVSPTFLLFFSLLATEIIAFVILKVRKETVIPTVAKKETLLASLLTFLSFFLYFLPINTSVGAGLNATIVAGTDSLMTLLGSVLILKLRPKSLPLKGYFISLVGILIIGYQKAVYSPNSDWLYGLSTSVACSFFFGLFVVYSKILLEKNISGNQLIFYRFFPCVLFLAPFAIPEAASLPSSKYPILFFYAVVLFALPVFIFIHCLKKLPVHKVALYFLFSPVFCLTLDWALHPTRFSINELIGIIIIFAGVIYSELRP